MLLALRLWINSPYRGMIRILGDAEGVLSGIVRLAAKSPQVNLIALEAALILAPTGRQLEALHLWSEDNGVADDLSRVAQGVPIPWFLESIHRARPVWDSPSDWHSLGKTS